MQSTIIAIILLAATVFPHRILAQAGLIDPTFDPGVGPQAIPEFGFVDITAIAVAGDGKLLVSGQFGDWNNAGHPQFVRLLPDGRLDDTFSYTLGGTVFSATPQGRKILIDTPALRRLNEDGSDDATFTTVDAFGFTRLAPDGTIVRAGTMPNSSFPYLSRWSADGALDSTFHVQIGASRFDRVRDMVIQPDGRIVIVGQFPSINGTPAPNIARLNTDGSLDTNFVLGAASISTTAVNVEADTHGGFYVAENSGRFVHVFSNGLPDTNFVFVQTGMVPSPMAVQADDKVVVGVSAFGPSGPHLIRFNTDGSRDLTYAVGFTNDADYVQSLAMLPDGHLIAGGRFTKVQGEVRNHVARLLGYAPVLLANRTSEGLRLTWPEAYTNAALQSRANWATGAWQSVAIVPTVSNGIKQVAIPTADTEYFRLRSQ